MYEVAGSLWSDWTLNQKRRKRKRNSECLLSRQIRIGWVLPKNAHGSTELELMERPPEREEIAAPERRHCEENERDNNWGQVKISKVC